MNEDTIIVCAGGAVLVLLLLLLLFIIINKPFKYRKRMSEKNTTLTIEANKNLFKVTVIAKFAGESVRFERKRIRKGQSIEFTYPISKTPAELIIEVEAGKQKVYEV
jgi:hypothetical protein